MYSAALPIGHMLEEYRIDQVLGIGAFGITYRCWDTNLHAAFALKEFFPAESASRAADLSANASSEENAELYVWGLVRFISEAQVLAQFRHPNIVRVSRYFQANNTAYIVMDYEEGTSLGEWVKQQSHPPTEEQLARILFALLEGLQVVHEKKYLHRDIKPSNIIIRKDNTPVLLDFGAAELEFRTSQTEGVVLLTPGYAPCEQYSTQSTQGPWSDLYALGATLYRCISGRTPVASALRQKAAQQGLPDPLVAAANLAQGHYSIEFLETLDWLLRLRPEERAQSARQVLDRLRGNEMAPPARGAFRYKQQPPTRNHKILFAGPVGAGKTTAISALSEIAVVRTDEAATDMTKQRKSATTVAMDYGLMKLSPRERLHLYGAPGQERFDFMWDILAKGALGLVVLIDNSRKDPIKDLDFYLTAFHDFVQSGKLVIGINFVQPNQGLEIEDYYKYLLDDSRSFPLNPPIFEIDARERKDVSLLVQALLYSIDPGVQDYNV